MNPFANPEEAMEYTYVEFPKVEAPAFELASFDQELAPETSSNSFVDFLKFDFSSTQNDTPVVQTAVFQDFKEVLPPANA